MVPNKKVTVLQQIQKIHFSHNLSSKTEPKHSAIFLLTRALQEA